MLEDLRCDETNYNERRAESAVKVLSRTEPTERNLLLIAKRGRQFRCART
jgi:hypothetical protein